MARIAMRHVVCLVRDISIPSTAVYNCEYQPYHSLLSSHAKRQNVDIGIAPQLLLLIVLLSYTTVLL